MTSYSANRHTIFHHRYHIVWITKYRYKVLTHPIKERVRALILQVAEELGVSIANGVVSSDHVHIFAEIPPKVCVSKFVQMAKGRTSKYIQIEFPHLRKQYWGRHFWARGYFSATSGNITDDVINQYINNHSEAHKTADTNIRLE